MGTSIHKIDIIISLISVFQWSWLRNRNSAISQRLLYTVHYIVQGGPRH